jgi:hypothetical protein
MIDLVMLRDRLCKCGRNTPCGVGCQYFDYQRYHEQQRLECITLLLERIERNTQTPVKKE